ncbi:MAG TPA: phosphotransferase [Nocardioidaceae bacterium]|jgi:Ser/Thr protein kinase RdoA (MazF antagonist)
MASTPTAQPTEFARASEEVAAAFALGGVRRPLVLAATGEMGRIFRLETDRGIFAVKELVERRTEEEVWQDVEFQERAGAVATTYLVARNVRTVDGRVLAEISGRQVRVQSWLDMAAPDPMLDPGLIGRMLAELHAAGEPRTDPVHPWYTTAVGAVRWSEYADRLTAARAPVASRVAAMVPRLVELEELLIAPTDLRTCHRDLWADNVRAMPDGTVCVFDWDNCGPADPDQELAMLAFEFGMDSRDRIRTLHDAYVAAGGPGRVTQPGDLTMVIAQFGHFVESAVQQFLDDEATPDDEEWALARLDELEERPLTIEAVQQIVDACA